MAPRVRQRKPGWFRKKTEQGPARKGHDSRTWQGKGGGENINPHIGSHGQGPILPGIALNPVQGVFQIIKGDIPVQIQHEKKQDQRGHGRYQENFQAEAVFHGFLVSPGLGSCLGFFDGLEFFHEFCVNIIFDNEGYSAAEHQLFFL